MVYATEVAKELDTEQPKPEKQTLLSKYDIPVQHLDFSYVKQCSDGKELEKILKILRSNEEGYFPELIKETEARLSIINPKSKLLRQTTDVLPRNALDKEEQEQLTNDMQEWLAQMKHINTELESCKIKNPTPSDTIPEIRRTKELKNKSNAQITKRIKSTDYESWEKYDPDTEILKIDLEEEKMKKRIEKEIKEKPRIAPIEPTKHFVTKAEAELEAQKERLKGNEFFKTCDYEYAITHYTRSITAKPTAPCFTNRALCYTKLKKYTAAMRDCQEALKIDANNVKAHLRIAECLEHVKKYESAIEHIDRALKIEPNNQFVQKLAKQLEKHRETNGKKTRLKIDDVSNSTKPELNITNGITKQQTKASNCVEIKTKPKKNQTTPAKSSSDEYQIVPYAGTSKMPPPYYKVIRKDHIRNHNFNMNAIIRKPQLIHLTVIDNSSDDEENLTDNIQSKCTLKDLRQKKNTGLVIHDEPDKKEVQLQNKQNTNVQQTERTDMVQPEKATSTDNRSADKQQILLNDKGGGGEPCVRGITPEAVNIEDLNSPYSFLKAWNSVAKDTSYIKHAEILKNLNTENLDTVIGNKLDCKMLSDILKCMRLHFKNPQDASKIHNVLVNLTCIPRFNIVKLFLNEADKDNFVELEDFLNAQGKHLDEDIKKLFVF